MGLAGRHHVLTAVGKSPSRNVNGPYAIVATGESQAVDTVSATNFQNARPIVIVAKQLPSVCLRRQKKVGKTDVRQEATWMLPHLPIEVLSYLAARLSQILRDRTGALLEPSIGMFHRGFASLVTV